MLYRHKCPHPPNTCCCCCSEDRALNSIRRSWSVAAAYFAEPLRHLHDPAHAAWREVNVAKKIAKRTARVAVEKEKQSFQKATCCLSLGAFTLRPSFGIGSDGRHKLDQHSDVGRKKVTPTFRRLFSGKIKNEIIKKKRAVAGGCNTPLLSSAKAGQLSPPSAQQYNISSNRLRRPIRAVRGWFTQAHVMFNKKKGERRGYYSFHLPVFSFIFPWCHNLISCSKRVHQLHFSIDLFYCHFVKNFFFLSHAITSQWRNFKSNQLYCNRRLRLF